MYTEQATGQSCQQSPMIGRSGMWCFRMWGFNILLPNPLTHISFRCKVPAPSVFGGSIDYLFLSNSTSSNTTSLNSQSERSVSRQGAGEYGIVQ